MPGAIVFTYGNSIEVGNWPARDNRLRDRKGRRVVVTEIQRPEPHLVMHLDGLNRFEGKLAEIPCGETRTGEELNLLNVQSITHIPASKEACHGT